MRKKALLAGLLVSAVVMTSLPINVMAEAAVENTFQAALEERLADPDRSMQSEIRWWIPDASLTDEVLLQEIQKMYDAGYNGAELCMQNDENAANEDYAYGSENWAHKWKLMMNAFLDHNMKVSLTSGTNWATANVAGLDPDSQEASQVLAMGSQIVAPGESISALPKPETVYESNKGQFLGAYAYKITETGEKTTKSRVFWFPDRTDPTGTVVAESMVDLTDGIEWTEGETVYDQTGTWTAPDDGDYIVFSYWTHGNYMLSEPGAEPCYAINYFDKRGVEAMKKFWDENVLDDPELNEKIKEGDVQLFMDSLELNPSGGITWWTEDIREEFIERKGYDIFPYLFLTANLPQQYSVFNIYTEPAKGSYDLEGQAELREKYINDWVDVLTDLYIENMLVPIKEWMNSIGIETRAQISYGRSFEITNPAPYVDYTETESLGMHDNIDILRLTTADPKLENKILSSETGGEMLNSNAFTFEDRLHDIYVQYAAGVQRVVWHIWSSSYAYGEEVAWPGWGAVFDRIGDREPNFEDSDLFNAHIGKLQTILQTGKSRTDIGFIHNNWNQATISGQAAGNDLKSMDYMLAHMGIYYRSTELQDNGYTYDYVGPDLLNLDTVSFDEETKTIEPAGYKALMIYQKWLDVDGAEHVLEWAKKGLPVVIMENAAKETPFNDGQDEKLAQIMEELKSLDNTRVAVINDAPEDFSYFDEAACAYDDTAYDCLQELGVVPYAQYAEANHQLLSQVREDEDGNQYLYVYNYCPNSYHENSYVESVKTEDHGTNIKTEIAMDGVFVPYVVDTWSGKVKEVANYRVENGKTIVSVDLDYDEIEVFAFEKVEEEKRYIVSTDAQESYGKDGKLFVRATESGDYTTTISDGNTAVSTVEVPESYDITGWDINIESWTPGENLIQSTEEVVEGLTTVNSKLETIKTDIPVKAETVTTWDNLEGVGKEVSGIGTYKATFNWDGSSASGAYLDLGGRITGGMRVWINGRNVGGDVSTNPTKTKTVIAEGAEGKDLYSGTINWMEPKADITEYLVEGENTIEIEFSSSLCNVCLSLGMLEEAEDAMGWVERNIFYRSYGPSQAKIVPYVDSEV